MRDCNSCAEKCPQAELAHQAALGRMYATNELVAILKKVESGELAPVVRWIPVTERLPELHTKVLCCGVKGGRFIAELSEWGNGILYWTKRDGKGCPTVTHWMPLPDPPVRKGENDNA